MNKALSLALALGTLLFVPLIGRADFVTFPREDAAWTVDISSGSPGGTSSSTAHSLESPTRIEVTQVGKLKRIRITWNDGKNTEQWVVKGLPVVFNEDTRYGLVRSVENNSPQAAAMSLTFSYDASAFSWITADCLQEKDPIAFQGKQCFHYLGAASAQLLTGRREEKREAWIDSTTGLPVQMNTAGGTQNVYTFQAEPPKGPLTPPGSFQKEILYYKTVMGIP